LEMMLHDAALLVVEEPIPFLDRSTLADKAPSADGPAKVAVAIGETPSSLQGWSNTAFRLQSARAISKTKTPKSLVEIQCEATPTMEGTAVFIEGRLAGLLLVNFDAEGKPTNHHGLLPVGRLRELLDAK